MTWNYRVVKKTYPSGDVFYGVHEVFYDADNSVFAFTDRPVPAQSETIAGLKKYLRLMLASLDKPVLVDGGLSERSAQMDRFIEPDDEVGQFIITYVPEADHMGQGDAYYLALCRDFQAADELERSVKDGIRENQSN